MTDPEPTRADSDNPGALPVGTRLGEYELRSVIGVGGFGIVYLAFDHALEREVAIKEYMPATLATRSQSVKVAPLSLSVTADFETGLSSFVNEGRLLARFDSPSLLKVYRYWEANGTAYITMPRYRGRTLKEHRAAMATPPDETAARALLMPLLSALELLHRESVYHRDIAPDNILIEADNRPVLLDFGAARRVIGEKSQALTAILKPAYAPIEQYGEAASVKQGAWTDLYALGATMHFYLLGQAPPPSTARAVQDEMQPLAGRDLPGCSKPFLKIIDWMLAPRPADRPQSVAALVDVLEGRAELPARPVAGVAPAPVPAPAPVEAVQRTQVLPPSVKQPAAGVDIPIDIPSPSAAAPAGAALPSGAGRRWLLPAAGVLALLAAAALWFWPGKPAPVVPPPPPVPPVVQVPVQPPAPQPAAPPQLQPAPGASLRCRRCPPAAAEPGNASVPVPPPKRAEAPRPPAPAASARRPKRRTPAPSVAAVAARAGGGAGAPGPARASRRRPVRPRSRTPRRRLRQPPSSRVRGKPAADASSSRCSTA